MIGFSIPVFFVTFREATEASIVVSVLLTFLHSIFAKDEAMRKKLSKWVWIGTGLGIAISAIIGGIFLIIWFKYATNLWMYAESLWEGCFSLIACILLTVMGFAFLQSEDLTRKWQKKLHKKLKETGELDRLQATTNDDTVEGGAEGKKEEKDETTDVVVVDDTASIDSHVSYIDNMVGNLKAKFKAWRSGKKGQSNTEDEASRSSDDVDGSTLADNDRKMTKSGLGALFWVPFVTVLREGLEGVVFLGGIGISADPGTIPIAAICGIAAGSLLGYGIYRAGNSMKMRTFFISASIFMFYLAAGLLVKAVLSFETYKWVQVLGGAGDPDALSSWDIRHTVFYLDCCRPNGSNGYGWSILSAVIGWSNQGTVSSIVMYCVYWLLLAFILVAMRHIRVYKNQKKAQEKASKIALANQQA